MSVAYVCEICQREIKREDLAGLEEILARKERLTTRGGEGIIANETIGKRMVMIPFCHECHAEIGEKMVCHFTQEIFTCIRDL